MVSGGETVVVGIGATLVGVWSRILYKEERVGCVGCRVRGSRRVSYIPLTLRSPSSPTTSVPRGDLWEPTVKTEEGSWGASPVKEGTQGTYDSPSPP